MSLDEAAGAIARWRKSPSSMVRDLFRVEPDLWQLEALDAFPHSPRLAMKACKGPGKTTVLAWLGWNFLLCYLHPKCAAVSITGENLADGLWTEMAKWRSSSALLQRAFEWTKTRIYSRDHPETWFMSARTWPRSGSTEQQADTLAGLHADNLLFLIDEAGGIPDAVMAAAEAGLANADGATKHAHIVMAGNPTHLEGPLYRACTNESALWELIEITSDPDDPKRTPRVSVEWAKQQIAKYGRDNPWVLVNVFGRFPPSSLNSLIGPDEVRAAMDRHYRPPDYEKSAKILGVDVALYGDDSSVIFPRQGLVSFEPIQIRNVRPTIGAGQVARKWADWNADACFIDATGGFGDPWAAALEDLNYSPTRVLFSGNATNARYFNKRAEMYFELCEWIRKGGAVYPDPDIVAELTATTYTFKGDKLVLEPKEQVKAKIGRSPDKSDALALTFAFPVLARTASTSLAAASSRAAVQADPFENY